MNYVSFCKLLMPGFILVSGSLLVCYLSMLFHGEEANFRSVVGTASFFPCIFRGMKCHGDIMSCPGNHIGCNSM
jgi:hypothetical protein